MKESKPVIFGSGASSSKDFKSLYINCHAALTNGITRFDTAPSYATEEVLSQAVQQSANELGLKRSDYQIQTKIDPIQMYNGKVVEYFKRKLETWEELVMLKEQGLTRKIGICNLRINHLQELKVAHIIPEILQIERHPLNIFDKEVLFCKENDIVLQDYSPLCKMHPKLKDKYQKDIGQIILKWHINTGAIPIFTSTKPQRISLYAHLDDFDLEEFELSIISSLNDNYKLYLESLVCPGF